MFVSVWDNTARHVNQTRPMIQTDQQFPSIGSQKEGTAITHDKSVEVSFGQKSPPGKECIWGEDSPGKGGTTILRLDGPPETWFDKPWQPAKIEEVK